MPHNINDDTILYYTVLYCATTEGLQYLPIYALHSGPQVPLRALRRPVQGRSNRNHTMATGFIMV